MHDPSFTYGISIRDKAGRKMGNRRYRRVDLEDMAHTNDSTIVRIVSSSAGKSPRMIVRIMNDRKDRHVTFNYLPRSQRGSRFFLIKWPIRIHAKKYLA